MGETWLIAANRDDEVWDGPYATREEAIEWGRDYFEGEPFWLAPGVPPDPAECMPDADYVLNICGDMAHDNWPECVAEDWPPWPSEEARKELDDFLEAWARKHLECERSLIVLDRRERIDPPGTLQANVAIGGEVRVPLPDVATAPKTGT